MILFLGKFLCKVKILPKQHVRNQTHKFYFVLQINKCNHIGSCTQMWPTRWIKFTVWNRSPYHIDMAEFGAPMMLVEILFYVASFILNSIIRSSKSCERLKNN